MNSVMFFNNIKIILSILIHLYIMILKLGIRRNRNYQINLYRKNDLLIVIIIFLIKVIKVKWNLFPLKY